MLRAYKYRIYPTKSQKEMFAKHFGCMRFVYNYFLKKRIDSYEKDKTSISYYEMQAELPVLKKQKETTWLKEVNSQSLQVALQNLDFAFQRFFITKKGFPRC